jgi:CRP-like cAMP-binding protein
MPKAAVVRFRNLDSRFFDSLDPAAVDAILSAARQRRYLANSVIVNQGHPADQFYLLASGRARYFYLTDGGRKVILRWIVPGDIFAPAALLSQPEEYLVSTEALQNSSVLVWNRATIRILIGQYPQLLDNVMLIMFEYFLFYRDTHTSLTCDAAPQRLAHVLAGLARSIGHKVPGGTELDVRNEELANAANVNSFTVSRLLNEWQRERILTKRRGKVLLRTPQKLFLVKD